jgi:hypothetical protein
VAGLSHETREGPHDAWELVRRVAAFPTSL